MNKALLIWAVLATCAAGALRIRFDRCEAARTEAEKFYQAARKEKP